jgi:hypothetical protein
MSGVELLLKLPSLTVGLLTLIAPLQGAESFLN